MAAILIFSLLAFQNCEEKACCLCSSFRYHAPCLVDLETGELIELDLYFPHATKVAELAEEQPDMDTFSLIRLGNVSGYRDTSRQRIELKIPATEKTSNPALCKACRQKLHGSARYVLADLYDGEDKKLIPIEAGMVLELRNYCITASVEGNGILKLVMQGELD